MSAAMEPKPIGDTLAVLIETLAARAHQGAGQVYELYVARFSESVDRFASSLSPDCDLANIFFGPALAPNQRLDDGEPSLRLGQIIGWQPVQRPRLLLYPDAFRLVSFPRHNKPPSSGSLLVARDSVIKTAETRCFLGSCGEPATFGGTKIVAYRLERSVFAPRAALFTDIAVRAGTIYVTVRPYPSEQSGDITVGSRRIAPIYGCPTPIYS